MIRACANWYTARKKVQELSDENYAILKMVFPDESEFKEAKKDFNAYGDSEVTLSYDELNFLPTDIANLLTFKPVKHNRFQHFVKKIGKEEVKDKVASIFQVHFANNDLTMVRKVEWLNNACTEELQEKLNKGFRILAVCPQSGNRRPDYVLGLMPQFIGHEHNDCD